jgi:hypothetical protein
MRSPTFRVHYDKSESPMTAAGVVPSIKAVLSSKLFARLAACSPLPPCGGGIGRGVRRKDSYVAAPLPPSARPRARALPHKGGAGSKARLSALHLRPRNIESVSAGRSLAISGEYGLNFRLGRKLPLRSLLEAALDGGNFLGRCAIGALLQLTLDLKSGLRQVGLSAFWPPLSAPQNFFDHLCIHVSMIAHKGLGGDDSGRRPGRIGRV